MSLSGRAITGKHKGTAFSPRLTKACSLITAEPSDKQEKLQKPLCVLTEIDEWLNVGVPYTREFKKIETPGGLVRASTMHSINTAEGLGGGILQDYCD